MRRRERQNAQGLALALAKGAINGIVQTVKRKSRGFRIFEYFRCMFYLGGFESGV